MKSNDPKLLLPFEFKGLAVERDQLVKDRNHHPQPEEEIWITQLLSQNEQISDKEVEFFGELKNRIGSSGQ